MEDMFRELNWQNKGILINGERLRFADNITLIARDQDELQIMIEELNEKLEQIGLEINSTKTKYLTNDIHQNQHTILDQKIEITI